MSLSVIIPTKTTSNFLPCAEAVRRHEPSARIIFVDDGMDLSWLPRKDLMPYMGLSGKKPFIFSRNCNKGIEFAGDDDVVLLNDDAILESPSGFSAMQEVAGRREDFGVISAVTNIAGNPAQLRSHATVPGGYYPAADKTVAFVCVFIPRRTIAAVGLLDERFSAYGYDDDDYCKRVRDVGLKVMIFDGCFVDHGSLRSTFRGDPSAPANLAAGAAIYRDKWGTA
jgi:hypothetical protein